MSGVEPPEEPGEPFALVRSDGAARVPWLQIGRGRVDPDQPARPDPPRERVTVFVYADAFEPRRELAFERPGRHGGRRVIVVVAGNGETRRQFSVADVKDLRGMREFTREPK